MIMEHLINRLNVRDQITSPHVLTILESAPHNENPQGGHSRSAFVDNKSSFCNIFSVTKVCRGCSSHVERKDTQADQILLLLGKWLHQWRLELKFRLHLWPRFKVPCKAGETSWTWRCFCRTNSGLMMLGDEDPVSFQGLPQHSLSGRVL